jgi:hypothetical protein
MECETVAWAYAFGVPATALSIMIGIAAMIWANRQ